MKKTAARHGIRVAVVAMALGVTLGLTGCLQSTTALPGSTKKPSPTASSSATSGPTTTPSPSPTTPRFVENCAILLTPAQVYAYNPNFVADSAYSPKPGSVPATIAANFGQTCGWINETSGVELEVAVATPPAQILVVAKSSASSGTPITASGEHGYFGVKNGVGSAQFFFGTLWLDVSSSDFATAADAQAVYPIVVQNQLKAGG